MAVSKRLRFEILRRDNHACRYCGATAPDVVLVVDHVVPESLGGRTEPANLVAACVPCNSGKTSISPDATLVGDVEQDALRWARAIEAVAASDRRGRKGREQYRAEFLETWNGWTYEGSDNERLTVDLGDGWENSLDQFNRNGLDADDLIEAIGIAMRSQAKHKDKFRYFCGVCWRMIQDRHKRAAAMVSSGVEDVAQASENDFDLGRRDLATELISYLAIEDHDRIVNLVLDRCKMDDEDPPEGVNLLTAVVEQAFGEAVDGRWRLGESLRRFLDNVPAALVKAAREQAIADLNFHMGDDYGDTDILTMTLYNLGEVILERPEVLG